MRDGRARFTSFPRLHPAYPEPPSQAQPSSQGLTLMSAQLLRHRLRSREVSERKQVGDVESVLGRG
jgi:hypothetical protein